MKGKKTISASLIVVLIASMVMFGASVSFAAPGTQISVDPPVKEFIGTSPGDYLNTNFVIKVNVTNVLNLYGWDIRLTYNSTLLQYVGRTVVGPNQVAPSQPANYTLTDVSVPGTIILGCAFSEVKGALPFDGSGVLAWITFEGKMIGVSDLDFVEGVTFLWDPNGMMISRDLCVGGEIEVIPEFPAAILLPLLLILTLIAVFLGKKFSQRSARMPSALSR